LALINLKTPIEEAQVRKLHIGDHITISGTIFTARDEAHLRALQFARDNRPLPFATQGNVLYHCGPVARQIDSGWEVLSAGPTTSTRLEKFEAEFIKSFGITVIIGKGGMLEQTQEALKEYGAVYCNFTGGAGVIAANFIEKVEQVIWLDLGIPEAVWVFKVKEFGPLLVAIDTYKNSIFDNVQKHVVARKDILLKELEADK